MSDATDKAELDGVLNRSVTRVKTDGLDVQYDLDQARRQRDELARKTKPGVRPRLASIDLSGF